MNFCFVGLWLLLSCRTTTSQGLDPDGKNVCLYRRNTTHFVCCAGWRQKGNECPIPICDGESSCQENEVCVFPGVCRCKPGFYGAMCKTTCPPEFWGMDCRELCLCHPHGRCHQETGKCTCLPNRWGSQCQNTCRCGRHGRCNPISGNCTCNEGWWMANCSKPCTCSRGTSTCDPLTGKCKCMPGHWGSTCSYRCNCHVSPCTQERGSCQCQELWWGPNCERRCNCDLAHGSCDLDTGSCLCEPGYRPPFCNLPCSSGYYGKSCEKQCGHCREKQPCSAIDGFCSACDPGWNGTRCDQPCPPGYHGNLCLQPCPHCRDGEHCDRESGKCFNCNPGWTGSRCDVPCSNGTYGDGCHFLCDPCFHGQCDHVTGNCFCQPGFYGESCNSTCPAHLYGVNCSSSCNCGENGCDPATGECHYARRGALIAGILIPLLLLLLVLICCCCCCGGEPIDNKDRVAVGDGGPTVRMKHHVYSVLANVSAAVPCLTLWTTGLPRVTVSHHDPEMTFNHSFIEPPSSGWVSDSSSFESDDGEAVYCVPPREDIPTVAGGEFQEMTSKCNMFHDPSALSSEDISLPFAIPRTSSNAKAKRPSVSFAEGTKFTPKERRGSAQEGIGLARKAKLPWGVLMLSALQGPKTGEGEEGQGGEVDGESLEKVGGDGEMEPSRSTQIMPGGRRRTLSSTRRHMVAQTSEQGQEKVSTVYVTVGKPPRAAKVESTQDGPVQAMLRRLGSLQRHREEGVSCPKGESITKPPRRKLGARVSMWEQAAVGDVKLNQRKHSALSLPCPTETRDTCQEGGPPSRPLSTILTTVPELAVPGLEPSSTTQVQIESSYVTVGPAGDVVGLSDNTNPGTTEALAEDDGPKYENVIFKYS